MRIVLIASVVFEIWALMIQVSFGQTPIEEPPVGEDPIPPLAVTIDGPASPVPVGTKQTLTAMHEPVQMPFYDWFAKCGKPARTEDDWTGPTIEDCVGQATIMNYSVKVTHLSPGKGPGSATFSIDFRAPNKCKVKTDPTTSNGSAFVTPRKVTLYYGDKVIGPCALVCCTEDWTFYPSRIPWVVNNFPKKSLLNWPECAGPSPKSSVDGGNGVFPGGTWNWDSPTLTDTQWVNAFPQIADTPIGTLLGHYKLKYTFRGPKCSGEWKKSTPQMSLGLMVRLVNGQKVAVIESSYTGGGLN